MKMNFDSFWYFFYATSTQNEKEGVVLYFDIFVFEKVKSV